MKIAVIAGLLIVALIAFVMIYPAKAYAAGRGVLRWRGGMKLKTVQAGGVEWRYLDGGNPQGPPVVLVHGFGADKDNWTFYTLRLCDTYRVICLDLPGFGESGFDPGGDYTMATQAARLGAFIDALGLAGCHLAGSSMGGFIALRLALNAPDRLKSLTLFSNAGVIGTEISELQQRVLAGESPLIMRKPADVVQLMKFIVYKPAPIPGPFLRMAYERAKPREAHLDHVFGQLAEDSQHRALNDALPRLQVPTLIIWGRQDRLVHVSSGEVAHVAIPDSELVVFDDCGHVPMIEKAPESAKVHRAFLARHAG